MDYAYDDLFNSKHEIDKDILSKQNKFITRYRTKTYKCGNYLDCEIYPLWNTSSERKRAKKFLESTKCQKNLNEQNSKKQIIRLTNNNFTDKDIWATFGYDNNNLPTSGQQAVKDMQNYIRRLKRHIEKNELDELKYIYVTEYDDDPKKKKRVHHHIIMNFADRDTAEKLWQKGGRKNTHRLQADEYGYEGLARYITKDPKGSKRFCASKNLKQPKPSISDTKITKGRALKLHENYEVARDFFEKEYENYIFNDCVSKTSDFVSGVYIYTRMRKLK